MRIWNVRPIVARAKRENVPITGRRVEGVSASLDFSFASCTKGFVHLGQYPSMTRSEYLSSTNAASIAGIVATKGRAHGVNCAALVSW